MNADILESGRFAIKLADGFFWGQAQVGGVIKKTESIALPVDEWFHLILSWDGKKLRLFQNNLEIAAPINFQWEPHWVWHTVCRWKKWDWKFL